LSTSPEPFRGHESPGAVLSQACESQELVTYDPLLHSFDLPLEASFYPRGCPVSIRTNHPEVLAAARESWSHNTQLLSVPPLTIEVGVLPAVASHPLQIPVCRSRENLLSGFADAHNFYTCDVRQGFAFCWLSEHAVRSHAYLRYHFLESAAFSLVTARYLTPIHGACVAWRGRGVLLCGDSGAGKSSLSFACAQRGWSFLSDDATCLVRGRKGRSVIGNPQHIHFRESALELFPDLQRIPLRPRINGDISIELPTDSYQGLKTAKEAEIDFVLFLNRQDGILPSVHSFPRDTAISYLSQVLCYGDKQIREEQRKSLMNLLSAEVLEFQYGDLNSAVKFLQRLIESKS
jgi:hypothetical protein